MMDAMSVGMLSFNDPDDADRCRMCLKKAKMTFEHIPPQDAGNRGPARIWMSEQFFRQIPVPRKAPRGTGAFALCGACNNRSTYVKHFGNFSRSVRERMQRVPKGSLFTMPFQASPLEVAKQMALIALAANPAGATQNAAGNSLRRHVDMPLLQAKPEGLRFFIYSVLPGDYRLCQYAGHIMATGVPLVFCFAEMAVPPVGLVVLDDNEGCDEFIRRVPLCEITHWFLAPPKRETTHWLKLPQLAPVGASSLDYVGYTDGPMYPSGR